MEGIRDNQDYTPEQMENIIADRKARDAEYQVRYQKSLRANPTPAFRARNNLNNQKQKPATKARQQDSVLSKRYHCAVCDVSCRDAASLQLRLAIAQVA
jgi:hypothetical protein